MYLSYLDKGDEGKPFGLGDEILGDAVSPLDRIVAGEIQEGVGRLHDLARHIKHYRGVQVPMKGGCFVGAGGDVHHAHRRAFPGK